MAYSRKDKIAGKKGKYRVIYFGISLFLFLFISSADASDEIFATPSNIGISGLLEMPSARVMKEGKYRVGITQADPYRHYYFVLAPLKGLEIEGRVTEIMMPTNYDPVTNPGPGSKGLFGNYTDKVIDIKYQLFPETRYLPALAVGFMDPQGSKMYTGQYVVASKQIYPFDLTIGLGGGRYGKTPAKRPADTEGYWFEILQDTKGWFSAAQLFWGVQFALNDEMMLVVEYSPIKYSEQTEYGQPFTAAVPSKFNFGLRWRPLDWLETDVSWQRGDQIGVNLSVAFDLGRPLIPLYDHPYREKPEHRLNPVEERIERGLAASGFGNVAVRLVGDELRIEAQNNKYYYTPRALGVMLRLAAEMAPAEAQTLRLVVTKNGIPMAAMTTAREDAVLFATEKITAREFLSLAPLETDIAETLPVKKKLDDYWGYGLNPSFRTFLNDPSGFFKYRFGVRGWVGFYPWEGASLVTGLEAYPLNTVSTANAPSATAVRTDIVPYQENYVVLGILLAEQIKKFPHEIYGRLSAGILEVQYAGIDAEAAMPLFGGRLMVGLSGSVVKKRDPDNVFGFKENDFKDTYRTAFLNTRLNLPEVEASIDLKTGQFLAGDRGMRVTLSKFFNGVVLSAWYSETNTDLFTDSFNRGYHDKGIAVTIPMRLFNKTDTKTAYSFGISPWTRDVAQDIEHFNSLFDFIGRDAPLYLKKDAPVRDYRSSGL